MLKRLALSLAAVLLSVQLASASAISARLAPAPTTILDPNVFAGLVKMYLVSDFLPADLRVSDQKLFTALNTHIVGNGGEPLTQAEMTDIQQMKTYYTSLGTAARSMYLDFLEGVTSQLQQGLLALVATDPQGYWDQVFLGPTQGTQVQPQDPQTQGLTRQADTDGGPYDQVEAQFAAEVKGIVEEDINLLTTGVEAAQETAVEAETAATEALAQANRGGGVAQAALAQSTQAIIQAQGVARAVNHLRPAVKRNTTANADQWKAIANLWKQIKR